MIPLRRKSGFACSLFLALAVLAALAPVPARGKVDDGSPTDARQFLDRIRADEAAGRLTFSEALLYRFQYIFAPGELPASYRVAEFSPLKCGTDLVRRYHQLKSRLDPETSRLIADYLALPGSRLSYVSTEGHFELFYELDGEDAVPAEDVDPVNGIPDFVEKAGQYLEQAWTVEVLMTGFTDPLADGGRCPVSFRSMQNYGYTYVEDENQGTTGIVMHNDFLGFPPNDDPDGDIRGAAKVTAAHEFKHATQYAGSRWSEGGWIELDAVWAEDLVFDQTNDYYNYLIGGSPIRHPEIPLDGGTTGTGSYEDCVFELWLQQTWGTGLIADFWQRRTDHRSEGVMDSYAAVLATRGCSLERQWGRFTGWNYATGYRSLLGLGYEEAARYPYGPVVTDIHDYPAMCTGNVEHLAAEFIRLLELDGGETGSVSLDFACDPGDAPLTVTLVIRRTDGTGVLETVDLQGMNQVHHEVAVPLQEIQTVAVVVGNPDRGGASRGYELTVDRRIQLPVPALVLETPQVEVEVPAGETTLTCALIGNGGQPGSVLHYRASVWASDPGPVMAAVEKRRSGGDKNISGSGLTADLSSYQAGADLALNLTVNNAGTDEEWLADLAITLPAGVVLADATPFRGGSLGDLVWNGETGDGVTTGWHGQYGSQGYGVIREGESASARLDLVVSPAFSGPLTLTGVITGDQFGAAPHSVPVAVTLDQFVPQLDILSPPPGEMAPLGEPLAVIWEQDGSLETVVVSLSRDGGGSWEELAELPASQGSFIFTPQGAASLDCLLAVSGSAGLVQAVSPGPFTLYPAAGWATCPSPAGEVATGDLAAVVFQCDAAGLEPGNEEGWLVVQHDGNGPAGVVPVVLTVTSGASSAGVLPDAAGLTGIYPNPFNPAVTISFRLEEEGPARLDILDIRGRRVRGLLDRILGAGVEQVSWNGRDDEGRILPAGIYLARLRTVTGVSTAKMMLAK